MCVTEIGVMGVKPCLDVMNDDTPEGRILSKLYNYVVAAPGGPLRVYWGLEAEDPSYLWAFFDWDSLEAHHNFAKTLGQEAVKDLPKILTRGGFTKHITATPSLPATLQSAVTQVILAYFASDRPPTVADAAIAHFENWRENEIENVSGIEALSYGWGMEKDFPIRGGSPDQRASICLSVFGFIDIAAQKSFRESLALGKLLGWIRGMEGCVKLEVFSICFRSTSRDNEGDSRGM
ncbi:uncharacterized protein BO95DRAFT_510213 [Aspergillus brunneoviolaceus CBS 621.78]|uniref:Uncharacterized protein n=1 Tax=Aspergillus brunneoviolaceus CBS 621.78 TaxID=1450534 RepID=A0ACD1GPL6_9EURO|nr:hypothetical protein BO95DRAFT_510213 [Aspergillus brunneoviolaceus CBS 621.78]RAH51115.1 hypothetical protein BO95DRAFT_510213 [Aspergillus brunneoviolaceus CBS 621.78]